MKDSNKPKSIEEIKGMHASLAASQRFKLAGEQKFKSENVSYRDFVGMYDNPWNEYTQELCDELIRWFDICMEYDWTMPSQIESAMPKNLREDMVLYPLDLMVEQHIPKDVIETYQSGLKKCLGAYVSRYALNHMTLQHKTFKMHKVLPTQGYHFWHSENGNQVDSDRILVYSTYLKVPEEGGETEFRHQSYRVKPIVGRTLIWPAGFTHTHRGNPPLDGEKYYITGWFSVAPDISRFDSTTELQEDWN